MIRFATAVLCPFRVRHTALQSLFCVLLLSLFAAGSARAQFQDLSIDIPGLEQSSAEWGDFDNDGDLDVVVTGRDNTSTLLSRIYRNDGGTFVDVVAGLAGVEHSASAWGDYDRDGDLDLLLSGLAGNAAPLTRLYRNDSGSFVDAAAGLMAVSESAAAWADFDGDGDLDLAVCGLDGSSAPVTRIYRNNGGAFANAGAALAEVSHGALAWGDYDNDGDPDLLLTGLVNGVTPFTTLYRNDAGTLVDSNITLVQLRDSAVAWMDMDNDGDLDFALSGTNGSPLITYYLNQGGGSFARNDLSGSGLISASLAWGDYDSDGDADLIISGTDSGNQPDTRLYLNNSGFSSEQNTNLEDLKDGSVAWGDYDDDGRLDLLLTGTTGSTPRSHVYRKQTGGTNTPPSAPSPISLTRSGNMVTFTWSAAGDNQTNTPGLSYNLRVGTTAGGDELISAMASSSTGFRRVVGLGNAGKNLSWTLPLAGLPNTTYWSVQTIDASFAGSPFSTPQSITYTQSTTALTSSPNPSFINSNVTLTATVTPATATGPVSFYDGANLLGTSGLSGGTATFQTTSLAIGAHPLTAVYAGDGSTIGSTSPVATHTVNPLPPSMTTVVSSPNPSAIGQNVLFTATVTPISATGSVQFFSDGNPIGGSTLVSGMSFANTHLLTLGAHAITAVYEGDAATSGSTSPPYTHTVQVVTTTGVASSLNPSLVGQSVTFTATVAPNSATGTVTFTDNDSPIGTGMLSAGVATFTTSSLTVSTHPIRAVYGGDALHQGSTSTNLDQYVNLPTTTNLTSNLNPANQGDPVTLTATVIPTPTTGLVRFMDGGQLIGSASVNGGVAALSYSFTSGGTHPLTASFEGNPPYAGSTSPVLNQTIVGESFINMTASPNPSAPGQPIIVTARVLPLFPTATGVVTLMEGATTLGASVLNGSGVAQFSIQLTTSGDHTLIAVYGGDTQVLGSTASIVQRVEGFTDISSGLPGLWRSSVAWGDYDNDGDLDILLSGGTQVGVVSRVYRNHLGTFVDSGASLQGVSDGSASWGDYDNDGDLDIVLSGDMEPGSTSRIYRNDNGTFVSTAIALPGVIAGSVAWGDYDNDGDLDLLLVGNTGSGLISRVYRNDGGSFVDSGASLPGVWGSSVAWGDYDNDGDLDILLTGATSLGSFASISHIYRNDSGIFVLAGNLLPGVVSGAVAWGDFDNDGDLDILLTGYGPGYVSRVYRNDENSFVDIGAGLHGVVGSAAWGDYDNDGDLDVLLAGGPGYVSRVYRNDGGSFAESGASLPGVDYSSVAWGDYDNDGDLDILLTGRTFAGTVELVSRIYRNNSLQSNTQPVPPTGLSALLTGNTATFSWNAATDAQTPAAGLTYNFRIGTTPGGNQISSAMANSANGYRRVPRLGNTNHRRSWTVTLPPATQYYWSVQAVDAAFAGSAFAAEQTLVPPPPFTDMNAALPQLQHTAAAWGDYDNDGDLDVLLTGQSGAGNISRVFRNDSGSFVDSGASFPGVFIGAVAWGDYDNDGDLDLLLTGAADFGPNFFSRVYRNDGGSFVDSGASLPGVRDGSVAWGDYDNDGDLDFLLTGQIVSGGFISRVYRNGGASFVDSGAILPGVSDGFAAWGDYDHDGDLDLLLTGRNASGGISRVYKNVSDNFVDSGASLPIVTFSSVAWGDYDNNGDLDILLTGSAVSGGISRIYRNSGGSFVDSGISLPGVADGSSAWGDFDNDGDLDILLTGMAGAGGLSRIYRNDGGSFVDSFASLAGVFESSVAWGDYDNDGDLDILLTGLSASGAISRVYRNNTTTLNTIPAAPSGLLAQIISPTSTFSWNAATDAQTPAAGLTYNLRIGTTPGGNQIFSGMADANSGYRRVPRLGNVGHRLSWPIKLKSWPTGGHIYWSVQAIDAAFAGSPWAVGDVSAVGDRTELPVVVALHSSTPNPFQGSTQVAFDLPVPSRVGLVVYDVRGRLVRSLSDTSFPAGRHEVEWDGTDGLGRRVGAGVYLVQMETGAFKESRRVVLLR